MNLANNCPNCQHPLNGEYCASCGQNQKGIDRFLWTLLSEAFEDIFSWNSRARKTITALLFKPGFLSLEYFAGRRARYVQPIRLYFISSILFFLLLTVLSFFKVPENIVTETTPTVASQVEVLESNILSELENLPPEAQEQVKDLRERVSERVAKRVEQNRSENNETEVVDEFAVSFLSEEQNKKVTDLLKKQGEKLTVMAKEDTRELVRTVLEFAPPVIFCLVPLFAFLLKVVYVYKPQYYAEHLVLSVHNHSFLFVILTLFLLLDVMVGDIGPISDILSFAVLIWVPLYLWLSLRNVYQQGRLATTFHFVLLGVGYMVIWFFAMLLAFLLGLLTL